MAVKFSSKILRRKKSDQEYSLYHAALEWDLSDPIVIESADDFKSARKWKEKLTPYHHQVTNLITFCRRLPVTLLADDVGLGKTISAGLIISELIARNRLSKILIVCPKILGHQWKTELKEKFDLDAQIAIGRDILDADPEETGAVITTYNTARMYLDKLPPDRFQMLVLDEAHALRNLYGTEKAPQVAKCFRKALEERRFRFVLMLTATPIQNRLWDLYSLVDLLTVARGHENPFGSEGMFVRKFIADARDEARVLKQEAMEEFRSIVYGYMSRVRRGDANLLFPERVVQMHKVNPTPAEIELIKVIAEPLQSLNRLTQISILQALTSSPDALLAQLGNMARKGTAPVELYESVKAIVRDMPRSAKLNGLAALIEGLKKENPNGWRIVIFTGRRETQTTIQGFLESYGLKVGIINGDSGERNQDTIMRFRANPPDIRVIVSTEAGSQGVNLQVANVLVNYDLPWNPMIVEQRIGRVQRLASDHAYVTIFNIMLKGTFEEYIVGRLMEKLQMASHAVGDIEALLQGSNIGEGEDDPEEKFEEKILELVLKALAGKDVEKETILAEKSIEAAKVELEREERVINELLGGMDGAGYVGPKSPDLPVLNRKMQPIDFAHAAYTYLGAKINEDSQGVYCVEEGTARDFIRFDENVFSLRKTSLCAPGSPIFQRLVSRIIASGLCGLEDRDNEIRVSGEKTIKNWVESFKGKHTEHKLTTARRLLRADVLARVRATVAHDSYERLVEINCAPDEHQTGYSKDNMMPIPPVVEDPSSLGLQTEHIVSRSQMDEGIAEFSRFYMERREHEVKSAGEDERKRKKLYDEFTPRIDVSLVGINGTVQRHVKAHVAFVIDSHQYETPIIINPSEETVISSEEILTCEKTSTQAPASCFETCSVSNKRVLKHLLQSSADSGRKALPEHLSICSVSKKKVLNDELEISSITGNRCLKSLLLCSAISGKYAEKEHFQSCSFTKLNLLASELKTSQVSGRLYRMDQEGQSVVSGRVGHLQEFVTCQETGDLVAVDEIETCEESGKKVKNGILITCKQSSKKVLPELTDYCAVSGNRCLKTLLMCSAISGKFAEKEYFQSCSFTKANLLANELKTSQISGRLYRMDQEGKSFVSGRLGHLQEFVSCQETGELVAVDEIETCEESGKKVKKGLLISCEQSGKRVLPQLTERCAVSGKRALKGLLAKSSISGVNILSEIAVTSTIGTICSPWEARPCNWSGHNYHPDDLRICTFTGLNIHLNFLNVSNTTLLALHDLLSGLVHTKDRVEIWGNIESKLKEVLGGGDCKIQAACQSPNLKTLAIIAEVRTFFGLKSRHAGFLYSIDTGSLVGRIVQGTRSKQGWKQAA